MLAPRAQPVLLEQPADKASHRAAGVLVQQQAFLGQVADGDAVAPPATRSACAPATAAQAGQAPSAGCDCARGGTADRRTPAPASGSPALAPAATRCTPRPPW